MQTVSRAPDQFTTISYNKPTNTTIKRVILQSLIRWSSSQLSMNGKVFSFGVNNRSKVDETCIYRNETSPYFFFFFLLTLIKYTKDKIFIPKLDDDYNYLFALIFYNRFLFLTLFRILSSSRVRS